MGTHGIKYSIVCPNYLTQVVFVLTCLSFAYFMCYLFVVYIIGKFIRRFAGIYGVLPVLRADARGGGGGVL